MYIIIIVIICAFLCFIYWLWHYCNTASTDAPPEKKDELDHKHKNNLNKVYLTVKLDTLYYLGFHAQKSKHDDTKTYVLKLYAIPNESCVFHYYNNDPDVLMQYYSDSKRYKNYNNSELREKIKNTIFVTSSYLTGVVKILELVTNTNHNGTYSIEFTGRHECGAYEYLGINDNKEISINTGNRLAINVNAFNPYINQ